MLCCCYPFLNEMFLSVLCDATSGLDAALLKDSMPLREPEKDRELLGLSWTVMTRPLTQGHCKSWTLDSGFDLWTGLNRLWTDIWTNFFYKCTLEVVNLLISVSEDVV